MSLPIGIHHHVPAADYLADPCETPSLSSSIAKIIVAKTPRHAWFAHPRLNPLWKNGKNPTAAFNLGNVVHELMLGKGAGFKILDYADYKTMLARSCRDAAAACGLTPILTHQFLEAEQICLAAHKVLAELPGCSPFNSIHSGQAETVLIWHDTFMSSDYQTERGTGVLCRAMLDFIDGDGNVWDIKTTSNGLSDQAISRAITGYGYDISAAFYLRGMAALHPDTAGRIKFRWVFVEVDEPFEVRVVEADATTLTMGDRKVGFAVGRWWLGVETNVWPGYARKIERIEYPPYAENAWLEREMKEAEAAE